jgi:hypothetical protein
MSKWIISIIDKYRTLALNQEAICLWLAFTNRQAITPETECLDKFSKTKYHP